MQQVANNIVEQLTDRELEIAWLISYAFSDKQIAQRLFIQSSTVRAHVRQILQKLDLPNRTAICRWYLLMTQEESTSNDSVAVASVVA